MSARQHEYQQQQRHVLKKRSAMSGDASGIGAWYGSPAHPASEPPSPGLAPPEAEPGLKSSQDEEAGPEAALPGLSGRQLEEVIAWETNSLFEYLQDLYAQGVREAEAEAAQGAAEARRRLARLRELLQRREGELRRLRGALRQRDADLAEREGTLEQQAGMLRTQREQIQELSWRLGSPGQAPPKAAPGGSSKHDVLVGGRPGPIVKPALQQGQRLPVLAPAAVTTYGYYEPPKWWARRRVWWGAGAVVALVVLLCAAIIPTTRHKAAAAVPSPPAVGPGAGEVISTSVNAPFVSAITTNSLDLHVYTNQPNATIYWAIQPAALTQQQGVLDVRFATLPLSSAAVLTASAGEMRGGVLANGSFSQAEAKRWAVASLRPPCAAEPLCQQSLYALQPGTSYVLSIAAVGRSGAPAGEPTTLPFTTLAADSGPALLPPSGPGNITANDFQALASLDAAGSVYYQVLTPKPGNLPPDAGPEAGTWAVLDSLPVVGSRRRRALLSQQDADYRERHAGRQLAQGPPAPRGSVQQHSCPPAAAPCATALASVFPEAAGYRTVASGCVPAPAAGGTARVPDVTGLQNGTLYYLLLASEAALAPAARMPAPAVYAVRTVDLSAPRFACGFPAVTNITASGFAVSAMLTKPAVVHFVVLTSQETSAPSAAEIVQGRGPRGTQPAAAGNLTNRGWLEWESRPQAGNTSDARKAWGVAAGLQPGGNYTLYAAVSQNGSAPLAGGATAAVAGILTPSAVPPTFTAIRTNVTVDENAGTFALQLAAALDAPATVFYLLSRNYSCIRGAPPIQAVVSAASLPASMCSCEDPSYCASVASGSFNASGGQGGQASILGDLSPLPFESLRTAGDAALKCFQGGLGQATDTYNVYVVAATSLPTHNGLDTRCASFAQAAETALQVAEDAATCPLSARAACSQARLRPDAPVVQGGAMSPWRAVPSSSALVSWEPVSAAEAAGRPATLQLGLEGSTPPAFITGPTFPPELRTLDGFGMRFSVTKPALVIYEVKVPGPYDADAGRFLPDVPIASGRVPVFEGSATVNVSGIQACNWPGGPGPMLPGSQYTVQYVARDKYGRLDGPCPPAHPRCTDFGFTLPG